MSSQDQDDLYSRDYPSFVELGEPNTEQTAANLLDNDMQDNRPDIGIPADAPSSWREAGHARNDCPPSPPPVFNAEADEITRASLKRIDDMDMTVAAREDKVAKEQLEWDEGRYSDARRRQDHGQIYTYPKPWPLYLCQILARFPALLERYANLQHQIGDDLATMLPYLREYGTYKQVMLLEGVEAAREQVRLNGNDFQTITTMMDHLEITVCQQIERKGDDQITPEVWTEPVTNLGPRLQYIIRSDADSRNRWQGIRDLERNVFPNRFEVADGHLSSAPTYRPGRRSFDDAGDNEQHIEDNPWVDRPDLFLDVTEDVNPNQGDISHNDQDYKEEWGGDGLI